MPSPPSSQYKVSNNPGRPSRGAARAVVTQRLSPREPRDPSPGGRRGPRPLSKPIPLPPAGSPTSRTPLPRQVHTDHPPETSCRSQARLARQDRIRARIPHREAAPPLPSEDAIPDALSTGVYWPVSDDPTYHPLSEPIAEPPRRRSCPLNRRMKNQLPPPTEPSTRLRAQQIQSHNHW